MAAIALETSELLSRCPHEVHELAFVHRRRHGPVKSHLNRARPGAPGPGFSLPLFSCQAEEA